MTNREWVRRKVIETLANPKTLAEQISFFNSRLDPGHRISDVEKWAMAREISEGIAALGDVLGETPSE